MERAKKKERNITFDTTKNLPNNIYIVHDYMICCKVENAYNVLSSLGAERMLHAPNTV